MGITEVDIPIFLNPYMFWIFEKRDFPRRAQLSFDLKDEYHNSRTSSQTFVPGEIVVAQIVGDQKTNLWYRGILFEIQIVGSLPVFEVWLMDFGFVHQTRHVFKISEKFKTIPAFVKQASLNNVVFIEQDWNVDKGELQNTRTIYPNSGTNFRVSQLLKDNALFFDLSSQKEGIFLGDILCKKDSQTRSLKKILIIQGTILEDSELFNTAWKKDVFNMCRYMDSIRRASKNSNLTGSVDFAKLIQLEDEQMPVEDERNKRNEKDTTHAHISRKKFVQKIKSLSNNEAECKKKVDTSSENNWDISPLSFKLRTERELARKKSEANQTQELHKNSLIPGGYAVRTVKKKKKMHSQRIDPYLSDFTSTSSHQKRSINARSESDSGLLDERSNTTYYHSDSAFLRYQSSAFVKQQPESNETINHEDDDSKKIIEIDDEYKKMETTDTDHPSFESDQHFIAQADCLCGRCKHWANSEDLQSKPENFVTECLNKNKTITAKSRSLFFSGNRDKKLKLCAVNYHNMTKLEKQASSILLVHGTLLPDPIERVGEATFNPAIHEVMRRLSYKRAKKIQSYVWPAIARYMNVCVVHRKGSGKTLAYLPLLCSFLLEKEERYDEFKRGGPIAVILADTSNQCEVIYDLVWRLINSSGTKRPRVILALYPFDHINLSNVDLLITIPTILIELLKKKATNLKRLCHLVLEDTDVLLDKYRMESNIIVKAIENMFSRRKSRLNIQTIMVTEHWTINVENFVKKLNDIPLIAIGDYLEAAIYGRIKLIIKCVESKCKLEGVAEILKDKEKWTFLKSIVLCNSDEEVKQLVDYFPLVSIPFIAITHDTAKEDVLQQEENWERSVFGNYKVLLCTDQTIETMLSITSAGLLIHFSLPEKWTFFIKRFNCLIENCKSPLVSDNNKSTCESYILIDELCESQLPRLLKLMKKYNLPLNNFEDFFKIHLNNEELEKIQEKIPICRILKQFGECPGERCKLRHILDNNLDSIRNLVKDGTVKFKVLEVLDVNHYKINIIEHRNIDGVNNDFQIDKQSKTQKLTEILSKVKVVVDNFVRGKSYAYWDDDEFDNVFKECVIEEIRENSVTVLLKENNRKKAVSKTKLFELPTDFCISDNHILEMIVANVKPPYKDETFCSYACQRVKNIFETIAISNLFVADVVLCLGNTIWVENIMEEIRIFDLNLTRNHLTKELIKRKLVEKNMEHMEKLYVLCKDAGIDLPKRKPIALKQDEKLEQIIPQWAFLDNEICQEVVFTSAISPDEFYVRLAKYDDNLQTLEKDITDIAERQESKDNLKISWGLCYAVKDVQERKYTRVMIKKIEDGKALCFAADYGDECVVDLKDIRYLSDHFIRRLPFQAIRCKLYGIQPIVTEYPSEAVDFFYDKFCFDDLYAKCVYSEKGIHHGRSNFSVLLKHVGDREIIINRLLVDCGWASFSEKEKITDFEIPSIQKANSDEEDYAELDEMKEIVQKLPVNDEDGGFEYFGDSDEDDVTNFLNKVMNTSDERNNKDYVHIKNELPAIGAVPFSTNYMNPEVYWSQTNKHLNLEIQIPEVGLCDVKLTMSRIFHFEAKVGEKKYVFNVLLYEKVHKDFKQVLNGLDVKITLSKQKELEWPKLSRSDSKYKNVHYRICDDEINEAGEKRKRFLDLGDEFKNTPFGDFDEAPMVTVLSDIDSELDGELPSDCD